MGTFDCVALPEPEKAHVASETGRIERSAERLARLVDLDAPAVAVQGELSFMLASIAGVAYTYGLSALMLEVFSAGVRSTEEHEGESICDS